MISLMTQEPIGYLGIMIGHLTVEVIITILSECNMSYREKIELWSLWLAEEPIEPIISAQWKSA